MTTSLLKANSVYIPWLHRHIASVLVLPSVCTVAQRSSCIRSLTFALSPSLRKWTPRPGFIFNRFHITFESCIPPEYLCTKWTIIPIQLSHHFHSLSCSFSEFKTEFNVRSLLHATTVTTSSHYLHNMAPYFPSCSAWGVAVLSDYRWSLGTWMACIAS